jgi:16S rRNA (adenine1518-N6/adenine1519-N6)-dimethyltransferase
MAWIQRELDLLHIPPLKRFGQHFLVDDSIRDELIRQARLTDSDIVLEIGPGLGFLTVALAVIAGHVVAVEKDRTLAAHLKRKFSESKNVTIVQGDALAIPIPDYAKIVSSPPYNISSKLIVRILNSRFKTATLLLQEEFAKRLTAPRGSRDYGRLTVMLRCRAQARLIKEVPRSVFYPRPRVNSAIVNIEPLKEELAIEDRQLFTDLVRTLFTQRRRKLKGVLSKYLSRQYHSHAKEVLNLAYVPEKRVFETSPEELANLSNEIMHLLSELKVRQDSLES